MSESAGPRRRVAAFRWWIAAAILALLGYRDLLWVQPERALPEEIEEWFFVPTETIVPLVVAMSLWLLYRRGSRLRALPARVGALPVGVALLAGGLATCLWATYTAAGDLLVPSLMLNACAVAWLWRGPGGVRAVALPVAFLAFAVPIPAPLLNELLFRLQIGTAELSGFFLYLLGIPHLVAGDQIQRTIGTFSVIEACSGLRSIEILTMVAILMADLFRRRGLHAVLVVLAAPPVAFLLNGVRALLLILNPHSQIATVHNLQGVAILLMGLVLLFLWDGLLVRVPLARSRSDSAPRPDGGARPHALAAPLVVGTLAAVVAASFWLPRWSPPDPVYGTTRRLAARLGLSQELDVDRRFLGSVGLREAVLHRVVFEGDDVVVFVGVGERHNRARSPISSKTGLPGSGWITEHETRQRLGPEGPLSTVRVMRSGSRRWLVYHWYEGAGSLPVESLRAWLGLDRSRLRAPQEIVAVRVEVPLAGPLETAEPAGAEVFLSFYHLLRPLLREMSEELTGKKFS